MTADLDPAPDPGLVVQFCGETHRVDPDEEFVIGRGGDLDVDDNPWLHRRFLVIARSDDLWWLTNEGDLLAATVSHGELLHTWMGPGSRLPLVLDAMTVRFTAGPTTYDFEVLVPSPTFEAVPDRLVQDRADGGPGRPDRRDDGTTTRRPPTFTPSQKALVAALAEPVLRGEEGVGTRLPSNAEAASRLGWSITRYNRKLDNVCERLAVAGVRGLKGGQSRLASQRRARLVEYALAARIVTSADLVLLEGTDPT